MKSLKPYLTLLLLLISVGAYANEYTALAKKLTQDRAYYEGMSIAVIPFTYADGSSTDGKIIAQRLENELHHLRLKIVEVDIPLVLEEQRRQGSGGFSPRTVQKWGKLVGAEAIVTGWLVETSNGKIEVNARLVVTETAEIIGAASVSLKRNWTGGDETSVYERPAYIRPSKERIFEVFFAGGSPNMALKFKNDGTRPIYFSDLGLWNSTGRDIGPLQTVQWKKVKTSGYGPVSIRFSGYEAGKAIGGSLELGYERRFIQAQKCKFYINDSPALNFTFSSAKYLTMNSLSLVGNLLLRFTQDFPVEPYIGVGIGISLNTVVMPHVRSFTESTYFSAPTNDFGLGFIFNAPVGVRLKLSDNLQLVGEVKYRSNTVLFDRGIPGETDSVKVSGYYFNLGTGFAF